jgi:hypothetical protein
VTIDPSGRGSALTDLEASSPSSPSSQSDSATGSGIDTPPPAQSAVLRWSPRLVPPLLYLAAALYMSSPFLAHPDRGVPGGADGTVYTWFFQWAEYCCVHLHNPFFTDWMNAPHGLNPMWNGSMLLVATLCAPLTATIGATATTGIVIMLAPALSATAAYLALRRVAGGTWGPALCASLYGFGPFFVGQVIHVHLSLALFPPLLLLLSHQLIVTQDRSAIRSGIWLGVTVAFALLTTEEVVALTAVVALFAGVVLALLNPHQVPGRFRHAAVGFGIGAAVAAAITAIPLWFQFFGQQTLQGGVGVHNARVDLASLTQPSRLMYYASPADVEANRHFPAGLAENTGYLGWPLIILALATCLWLMVRRDRLAYWWLATTVVCVLLSLGPEISVHGRDIGHRGPWYYLDRLPVFNGAIPVRISLLTTLLVALILARGLGQLRGRALAVGLVVVAAALVPLRPAHRYTQIRPVQTPRFFTTSAVHAIPEGATALLLPTDNTPEGAQLPMTWQIQARMRFKIIGGYGVFNVNGTMSYQAQIPAFAQILEDAGKSGVRPAAGAVAAARTSIASSGTSYIVITGTQPNAPLVEALASKLTGCTMQQISDVSLCAIPGR